MAYVSQQRKAELAPGVKAVLKKYNVKGTLSVNHHSSLVLNVKSGEIDFISNMNETCSNDHYQVARGFKPTTDRYIDVNVYHFKDHFSGKAKDFISEVYAAMKGPDYFDHSDSQSDYFHCSHYISINVGQWDKPYILTI